MSQEQTSPRDDIQRLVDDGYDIEIRGGYLIMHRVPYVTDKCIISHGQLVCPLTADGPPPGHTMYFEGNCSCDFRGPLIEAHQNNSTRQELAKGLCQLNKRTQRWILRQEAEMT